LQSDHENKGGHYARLLYFYPMRPGIDVPVVLYDGNCGFCSRSVQFIWRKNKKRNILFASLQSETAAKLAESLQTPAWDLNSMVLVENGKAYRYSSGALRVCKHLRGLWKLMYGFLIVPPFIRDFFYKRIAANRHKLGNNCPVPEKDFLDRTLP
jgi:predicted DCC family thiol-disulfide oxidoreductase YuxK